MILEIEWVLRGVYQLDRVHVNSALRALLSLERTVIEDEATVFAALDSHAQGMDFADAMHLSSSRLSDSFATFDSAFRKSANKLSLQPQVTCL